MADQRYVMMTYTIPAGSEVRVCKYREFSNWKNEYLPFKPHTTKRELTFSTWEHMNSGCYLFREGDWLIRVGGAGARRIVLLVPAPRVTCAAWAGPIPKLAIPKPRLSAG